MGLAGVLYAAAGFAAGVIQIGCAAYIWWRTEKLVPPPAVAVLLAGAEWVLAMVAEFLSASFAAKVLADQLQFVGLATLPVTFLVFCLHYARRPDLARPAIISVVSLIPVAAIVLVLTNNAHGFMWDPAVWLVGRHIDKSRHWGFWLLVAHSYLLIAAGVAILARPRLVGRTVPGAQARALLLAALLPCAATLVDLLRPPAIGSVELTPLAFSATAIIVVYGFARLQFEDQVPVAHRAAVETMRDLVVVTDQARQVLYLNPAAQSALGVAMPAAKSRAVAEVCPAVLGALDSRSEGSEHPAEIEIAGRFYDASVSPVTDRRLQLVGNVMVLRDVTALRESERLLRELAAELEERVRERTAALQEEVRQRTAAQAGLARSLQEKEVLLRELHHRVKNNLQVISSLLRLQAAYVADPQSLQAFEDSLGRIRAMALMHDLLRRRDCSLGASDYVRRIASSTLASYGVVEGRVSIDLEVENIALSDDQLMVCGLIISELVSNALKHAFPGERRGRIRIGLSASEGSCILSVGDDGVGLPEHVRFPSPASLGLRIVVVLARQLGGELTADRREGAAFAVRFPASEAVGADRSEGEEPPREDGTWRERQ